MHGLLVELDESLRVAMPLHRATSYARPAAANAVVLDWRSDRDAARGRAITRSPKRCSAARYLNGQSGRPRRVSCDRFTPLGPRRSGARFAARVVARPPRPGAAGVLASEREASAPAGAKHSRARAANTGERMDHERIGKPFVADH